MQAVAKKNKKNKKKVIVGATDNPLLKGVCKKSVVCVSRLEPGTTADIVRDHLTSNSIDVLSCYDLNKLVRPRWPYDMRPSAPAEKYICVIVIR